MDSSHVCLVCSPIVPAQLQPAAVGSATAVWPFPAGVLWAYLYTMCLAKHLHAHDIACGRKVQYLGNGMPAVPFSHGFDCGCVCGECFVRSATVPVQRLLHICMAANNGILQCRHDP